LSHIRFSFISSFVNSCIFAWVYGLLWIYTNQDLIWITFWVFFIEIIFILDEFRLTYNTTNLSFFEIAQTLWHCICLNNITMFYLAIYTFALVPAGYFLTILTNLKHLPFKTKGKNDQHTHKWKPASKLLTIEYGLW
jgi:hypothetical protein